MFRGLLRSRTVSILRTSFPLQQCRSSRYIATTSTGPEYVHNPPEDFDGPVFEFPEEPLGLPATTTFGFFQGGPGDVLGKYVIQAKLGHGVGASVWLAKDREQGNHVALKILSGYTTPLNKEEKLRELICLQRLAAAPEKNNQRLDPYGEQIRD